MLCPLASSKDSFIYSIEMGRAPCCEKVGLKRGRWTAEEDEMLTKYILSNGEGSWRSLPKNAGLLRCGKSCRLRWINYLRADLKRGNITKEEEETIVKLHTSLGNRWSLIAAHLPGRTDNEIKNYWNSHLSRSIYSFRRNAYESSPTTTTAGATTAPWPLLIKPKTCTTNCSRGKTSRAAMKKQRAALISLRKREQQQPMPHPNQVIATQITEETDPVVHYNTPTFSFQISGGSGSGSGSTTSSDRNGTQDLELGNINKVDDGSSCGKFNGAENGDADMCCRKSGDDAGQEDESLGPYEWLDSEIKRLEYILQEGEGEGVPGSGINSIDSLEKEIEVGGGANNGDGRGPIHDGGGSGGGEIMMERTSEVGIESDWAYIRRSPSPSPGLGPGPRIGDEGLDFLFDWDWPAGADGDHHHHHGQWEWDLLWGEDDGIGSSSPLNYY